MGVVYLARQERVGGRAVALKVLPASFALSSRARERFRLEAEAIARLQHPHVVAVYDVIHHGDIYAYAMEYVQGRSLGELVGLLKDPLPDPSSASQGASFEGSALPPVAPSSGRAARPRGKARERSCDSRWELDTVRELLGAPQGAIPETAPISWICRIGVCIARALGAVHRAGFLHRDVKPSNILIRQDGTPLLTDFGLVRESASELTQPGTFAGTPAYAPPEQLRGEVSALTARSDVYALGATLYHALTLQAPFRGATPHQILKHIGSGATSLRRLCPKAPRDLETIIAKAMDPDPARRYATADEFADDLERMLNLKPVRARRIGPLGRGIRFIRRNRTTFAAAVAASVLTLGLATAAVIYAFFVPRWFEGHVREARLALIGPEQQTALFNVYWLQAASSGWNLRYKSIAPLDRALSEYDRALRLRPWDTDIQLEREVVQFARLVIPRWQELAEAPSRSGSPARDAPDWPVPSVRLRAAAPRIEVYAAEFRRNIEAYAAESRPRADDRAFPDNFFRGAGSVELRLVGLLAYLLIDVDTAIAARTQRDAVAESDPLQNGALGLAFLLLDQPGRSYPRLRDACDAFPGVGFLFTAQADAAIQCGDLDRAGRLLAQAGQMGRLPSFDGLQRIQARYYAARAEDGSARAIYEEYLVNGSWRGSGVMKYDYAQFLESRGDLQGAVHQYAGGLYTPGMNNARLLRHYTAVAERWWSELALAEKAALLRLTLDERPGEETFRFWLEFYRRCHSTANEIPDSPLPGWLTASVRNPGTAGTRAVPVSLSDPEKPASFRSRFGSAAAPLPSQLGSESPALASDSLPSADFAALSGADSSPTHKGLSLSEMAERMEVTDQARWERWRSYSPTFKTLQCWAWMCPCSKQASDVVEWLHDVARRVASKPTP